MIKQKPNYLAAYEAILSFLREEDYNTGDVLPSRKKLSEILRLGLMPIQQALNILAKEGVLANRRGSGCYLLKLPESPKSEKPEPEELPFYPGSRISHKKIKMGIWVEFRAIPQLWRTAINECLDNEKLIEVEFIDLRNLDQIVEYVTSGLIDIIQIPAYLLPFFASKDILFNPDEAGGIALGKKEFYDGAIEGAKYKGTIFGVPLTANTACVMYRKEYGNLFDGLSDKSEFWAFLEELAALVKDRKTPVPMASHCPNLFELMAMAGMDIKNYDRAFRFDDPGMGKFLKRFEKYLQDERIFYNGNIRETLGGNALKLFHFPLVMGNSSWLIEHSKFLMPGWEVLPPFLEKGGYVNINTQINVVSAYSQYPLECLDIIRGLADCKVQKYFAAEGRLTSHRKANEYFKLSGLSDVSKDNLLKALTKGKILSSSNIHIEDYFSTVFFHELNYWQNGKYSCQEFQEMQKRKSTYFFKSRALRESTLQSFAENSSGKVKMEKLINEYS